MSSPHRIAADQDGIITRKQALGTGMTKAAIRHAIRPGGPWQRVLPGIYATFTGSLSDRQRIRAAALAAGPGAIVTGPWACRVLGLTYGPDPGEAVDVLIDRRQDRRSVGYVRITRTSRLPEPVHWTDHDRGQLSGLPLDIVTGANGPGVILVAPVARAVVDTVVNTDRLTGDWRTACDDDGGCPLCRFGPGHEERALRNVRALMCESVQRRRTTVNLLDAETAAAPRRGGRLARAAMNDIRAGCRSAPECELRDVVRKSRILPEARWNQPLPGDGTIVPDACWPEARLVVEVDSRSFHGFGDAPARTEERRARYAALGWRVLPVSPARLRRDPRGVRREIEAAYLAGV